MKKSFLGPNVNAIAMPFIYLAASVLLFVFLILQLVMELVLLVR